MFRITRDPSSGSFIQCLAKITVMVLSCPLGHGLLILEISRSQTTTHHSRWDFSGRVISPSQSPLPHNTQHSTQTNIHALAESRTHDPSKPAAVDLRLKPRGH